MGELQADFIRTGDMPFRWIPVSERLPDFEGMCLVAEETDNWNPINEESYKAYEIAIRFFDGEEFHPNGKVLAWMPLPEPYKPEQTEV